MIVDFCRRYLDINISKQDISVSHRQWHPDEQRKQGKDYIPPIYCKFVSRSLAKLCIDKKHYIRKLTINDKDIFIRENLTFNRRSLMDRVQKQLHSYQYKWAKNGKVFVKKSKNSRVIRVLTEDTFSALLKKQNSEPIKQHADFEKQSYPPRQRNNDRNTHNHANYDYRASREPRNRSENDYHYSRRPSRHPDAYEYANRPRLESRPGYRRPSVMLSDFIPERVVPSYSFFSQSYSDKVRNTRRV